VLQGNFARYFEQLKIFYLYQFLYLHCFMLCTQHCIADHEVSFTFSLYERGYLISKSASVSFSSGNLCSEFQLLFLLALVFLELERKAFNYEYTADIKYIYVQMDPSQTSIQDGKTLHPYDRASEKLFSVSMVSLACKFCFSCVLGWHFHSACNVIPKNWSQIRCENQPIWFIPQLLFFV